MTSERVAPLTTADARGVDSEIFRGSGSHWAQFGSYLGSAALLAVGATALIVGLSSGAGFGMSALGGVLLLTALITGVRAAIAVKSEVYVVSRRVIQVERGLVGKKLDYIDIMRVRDVGLSQSFVGRMVDVGDITVFSSDASHSTFVLRGIPKPREIYEALQAEALSNARRAVLRLEE